MNRVIRVIRIIRVIMVTRIVRAILELLEIYYGAKIIKIRGLGSRIIGLE